MKMSICHCGACARFGKIPEGYVACPNLDLNPNCEVEEKKLCKWCEEFFSKYRCNKPEECDCPKCQGLCECK